MVRRRQYATVAALLLAQRTMAQTTTADPLGVIVSEAYSVYTAVTGSYLPSVESAASAATASASSLSSEVANGETIITSSSSTSTSSSSSSLSTSTPISTGAANTSSPTNLGASATAASSAAAASASASSSKHNGGNNTLAIALGAGLGALALGLLLLVAILLCCRRRRRSRNSTRHAVSSVDDDEVAAWRRPAHRQKQAHGTHPEMVGTAPLMADHPAYRHDREGDNPFADPVPVPAERQMSAPNSRAGLTDSSVPGDDPYLMHGSGEPVRKSGDGHHVGGALAAGAGGAALGAAAMHHHNKNGRNSYDDKHSLADGCAFGTTATPKHDQHGHVQYDEKHHPALVHELSSDTGLNDDPRSPVSPLPVDDQIDRSTHGSNNDHHLGGPLLAGAAGTAVGAATTQHGSKHDSGYSSEMQNQPRTGGRPISRKPIANSNVQSENARPYPTPSTNDDAFAMNQTPGHRSMDSSHRRHSRDPARANEAFNNAYSSDPHHGHHGTSTAAALGAGAVGGAALTHHNNGSNRSRSNSAHASRSPHRRSLLATKANGSDNSNTSSDSSKDYTDALPHQRTNTNTHQGPHDVPPVPVTRSRRNSSLGTGAPPAAVNSYANSPQPPRDRSTSSTRPHSYPYDHNDFTTNVPNSARTRTSSPPTVPSRSPHRHSRDSPPFASNVRTESPLRNQLDDPHRSRSESVNEMPEGYDVGSPYDHPDLSTPSAPPMQRGAGMNQGIVGDNGYPAFPNNGNSERRNSSPRPAPEMYNAKRNSGPRPAAHRFDSRQWENGYPVASNGNNERRNSSPRPGRDDDASYRVSHGMPGGWQRAPSGQASGRNSMEQGRKSMDGKRSSSQGRLRLADLRREEEEKARSSGMWFGQGGGQRQYEGQGYGGVGQAL